MAVWNGARGRELLGLGEGQETLGSGASRFRGTRTPQRGVPTWRSRTVAMATVQGQD